MRFHDAGFAVGTVVEAGVALVVEGGDGVVVVFGAAVAVIDDGGVDQGGEVGEAMMSGISPFAPLLLALPYEYRLLATDWGT